MTARPSLNEASASQNDRYRLAIASFGPDIARFAMGYERDAAKRQELVQEIHVALWQSFATYKEQCSLRTWTYRIAHNVGATHIQRSFRLADRVSLDLDEAGHVPDERDGIADAERRMDMERLLELIHKLAPLDREVMLLYLEDLDAAAIGDVTGISARNVATKVHRIKALLARQLGSKG